MVATSHLQTNAYMQIEILLVIIIDFKKNFVFEANYFLNIGENPSYIASDYSTYEFGIAAYYRNNLKA